MLSGVELVPLRARTPGREEKDESIPMAKKAQEVRGDAKEEALAAQGNRRSFTFSDLDDAVDARERDFFAETAGPENFQLVDFGGGAEAEMDTRVGRRSVAGTAEDVGALANAASGEEYFGTNGVAGGFVDHGFRG